jgi:hypothetical protein
MTTLRFLIVFVIFLKSLFSGLIVDFFWCVSLPFVLNFISLLHYLGHIFTLTLIDWSCCIALCVRVCVWIEWYILRFTKNCPFELLDITLLVSVTSFFIESRKVNIKRTSLIAIFIITNQILHWLLLLLSKEVHIVVNLRRYRKIVIRGRLQYLTANRCIFRNIRKVLSADQNRSDWIFFTFANFRVLLWLNSKDVWLLLQNLLCWWMMILLGNLIVILI